MARDDLSPMERLNLRLGALAQANASGISTPAPTTPDALAAKYISLAEAKFADPVARITVLWKRQEHPYEFSRAVHEFDDYEAFIFKLSMVMTSMTLLDQDNADLLQGVTTYSDGKAITRRAGPKPVGYMPHLHDKLPDRGYGNQIPGSLSFYADDISRLIQSCRQHPSQVLRSWVARHVGGSPGDETASTSQLFASEAGPYTLPLGTQPDGRELHYKGEASLLTIAPPGKGKTQCHVLPALASYKGPAIVLDIKGECYDATAARRRETVGPVLRFNPVEPETSSRYNPLDFVDADPDELWESSRFLADLLVVMHNQKDATWETQGKDLLTLIIAFVAKEGLPGERTMATVLDFVATVGLADMLAHVKDPANAYPGAMRRAAARFAQMQTTAPKQFEGVLSGASQHLLVWEGPKVERVTAATDWKPSDFRAAPYPTLYLCIPPNAVETYSPLLRVIVGQHVRLLMKQHRRDGAPVLLLLDELPRLGKMEPVREALEVGRSYGIKLWMIAQYPEQIINAYPGVGEGMMESCDVRMYMNPSAATAEKIEKAFGQSKNVLAKKEVVRLAATEILGPTHRDSIFVLASNEEPRVLKKRFFHQQAR